jgi:hypothetical protein
MPQQAKQFSLTDFIYDIEASELQRKLFSVNITIL